MHGTVTVVGLENSLTVTIENSITIRPFSMATVGL